MNPRSFALIALVLAIVELDMDDGSLWNDLERSNSYRDETLDYVQACLGMTSDPHLDPPKSGNATVRAFETIGTAIRQVYNYGLSTSRSRKLLFDMTGLADYRLQNNVKDS